MYNPSDYAHLDVSSEIKDLFQYIQRYKPQKIDLETRLKPFIPGAPLRHMPAPPPTRLHSFADFIPAVGDIDPFIKIPRPDGKDGEAACNAPSRTSTTCSSPVFLFRRCRPHRAGRARRQPNRPHWCCFHLSRSILHASHTSAVLDLQLRTVLKQRSVRQFVLLPLSPSFSFVQQQHAACCRQQR